MFALAAFFGLLLAGVLICNTELRQYLLSVLAIAGILVLIWMGRAIHRARLRHRERLPGDRLSDDELRKARAKLQNRGH